MNMWIGSTTGQQWIMLWWKWRSNYIFKILLWVFLDEYHKWDHWIIWYHLSLHFWVIPYYFLFAWIKYLGALFTFTPIALDLPPLLPCNELSFSVPLMRAIRYMWGIISSWLWCTLPWWLVMWSIFHMLVNHIYSLFGEMSIEFCALILIGLFVFLLLSCRISWNMLDRNSLISVWFAILSLSVSCLLLCGFLHWVIEVLKFDVVP